jgi:hypothetical protein
MSEMQPGPNGANFCAKVDTGFEPVTAWTAKEAHLLLEG